MNPLLKKKQQSIGILDLILVALYIALIIIIIITISSGIIILRSQAESESGSGSESESVGEAVIGGMAEALAKGIGIVIIIILFVPVVIILFIGMIFWIISGAMNLAKANKGEISNQGFNSFIAVIQVISAIIMAIVGIGSFSSLANAFSVDGLFAGIIAFGITTIAIISVVFKTQFKSALRHDEDVEEIKEAQHTVEHRADKDIYNISEDENDD